MSEMAHRSPPHPAEDTIQQWRLARGLQSTAVLLPGAKHVCAGRPTFSRLGTRTFLCDHCGWAHVCDPTCSERLVPRGSDLPVCPISGRCFERMMSEEEVGCLPRSA